MGSVGFIGAGNMGLALARALVAKGVVTRICVYDPKPERLDLIRAAVPSVQIVADNTAVAESSETIFLAVKPQDIDVATAGLRDAGALVISIVAGLTLDGLQTRLPMARLIRVMPNTPCLVGEMAAGFAAGATTTAADRSLAARLLGAAGLALEMDEGKLDAVTGLSGSGPAFMARIFEAFIASGVDRGLEYAESRALTLQTALGTAKLLQERGMSVEELVSMVSSPGGTTVAGRQVLESSDIASVLSRTIAAATQRSRELGKG